MYETRYHRPGSLSEAAKIRSDATDGQYLCGGQTLIPTMKHRLASPSDLVDLSRLSELRGISEHEGVLTIGAATTHSEVASSDDVEKAIPALVTLAGDIGDPAVRHKGTIGGSLANNDPAADYPAAALGLGATIHTDKRTIAADDFFRGLFATALDDGEIVVKVGFPVPSKAAYAKFHNPASRYALTGVFVAMTKAGDVRVAVTGAGANGVFRASGIETALSGSFTADAVAGVAVADVDLLSDMHGSAEYRANLIKVMAGRAVASIG
ncbi:MAG: xanthine dehydrogenase family protein subunit M [Hyphomicrobiales bacterium]|nr:xanthine dehydrogenase family protein subunit M [Hyphomicrobiales bacterium]